MAEKSAKRRVYIYIDGSQVANSVDAISKELRKVQNAQKKLVIGSDEYVRAGRKITQLNSILKQHSSNINQAGQSWLNMGKITDGFNRFFGIATSIIAAITGITFAVRKSVDEFAALEEKEADVRKYTGMTANQVKDLNEEFKKMDTRSSREQLNSLAADAGRLGIKGKQDILEFVEAADIINVSLGEDLGKDAIKNIGKLAEMFGTEGQTLKEGMLSVGSAINEIAQNSSAAEPYLVDFAARLAGTSKQAGISISDLLGFGSALDQNMNQVEMASTALQTLMLKLYQSPAKFAKMAGKDVEEFTKLMKTDANEALLQLLSNLKQIGGLDKLAPMFKEMGLDGVRASGVINTLATNVDKIRKEQETANKAYKEGTSAINEFTIKNNTLLASFEKAKKRFKEVSYELGEKLSPYMANFISLGGSLVKVLSTLTGFFIKNSAAIMLLTIVMGSYFAILKSINIYQAVSNSLIKVGTTLKILHAVAVANLSGNLTGANKILLLFNGSLSKNSLVVKTCTALTYLYAAAKAVLTGNIGKARVAMAAFNSVTKLNSFAAMVAVIAAVVAGFFMYVNYVKDCITYTNALNNIKMIANETIAEEKTNLELLWQTAQNELLSKKKRQEAIREINRISPEYLGNISLEAINTDKATEAKKKYIDVLLKEAMAKAASDKVQEKTKEILDIKEDMKDSLSGLNTFSKMTGGFNLVTTSMLLFGKSIKDTKLEKANTDLETYLELFQSIQGEIDKAKNPEITIDLQLDQVDSQIAALQNKMSKFVVRKDFSDMDNDTYSQMEDQLTTLQTQKEQLIVASKNLSKALNEEGNQTESLIAIQENLLANAKMMPEATEKEITAKNRKINVIETEIARLKGLGVVTKKEAKDALKTKKEAIEQEEKTEQAAAIMKYATGTTTKSEFDEEMLALDRKYTLKKMVLYKKDSLEHAKLNMELRQTFITEKEKTDSKSLKDLDKTYQDEKTALVTSYTDKNISKKAYDEGLLTLDLEYLKKKRDIYIRGSEEWQAVQNEIDNKENDAKVKKQEEFERKIVEYSRNHKIKYLKELEEEELRKFKSFLDDKLISVEEYEQAVFQIEAKYSKLKNGSFDVTTDASKKINDFASIAKERALKKYNDDSNKKERDQDKSRLENGDPIFAMFGSQAKAHGKVLDELKQMEDEGLMTHKQYLMAKASIDSEYFGDLSEKMQAAYATINSVVSAYSEFNQASLELEEAKINKKYDSEIKAAGNNSNKKKKIEEQKEKELAKVKSKYADRAFQIQLAQGLAQTAIGAISAYSSAASVPLVGYILGPIAATAALAAGMLQIATIKKQHEASKVGYASGGFTPKGKWDEEQGVVHSDEFVANRFATSNSTLRPVFDMIDYAQKSGTVANLTREDLAQALSVPGYSNGGYAPRSNETSSGSTSSSDSMMMLMGIIDQNTKVMEQMYQRLNAPLDVINTVDGNNGMKRAWDEYNSLINNKTRS